MSTLIPRIFIGSSTESLNVALALQAELEPVGEVRVWNQDLFRTGNSALEDLLRLTGEFDYAAFIWSSDDMVVSRGTTYFTPRDNVILEAGMFYAALGRDRVVLILPGETPKIPSDLAGITNLFYREPSDQNYRAALGPACRNIREQVKAVGVRVGRLPADAASEFTRHGATVIRNVREAWEMMKADCQQAETIAIIGNRGLGAFGTDHSLISLAEIDRYPDLRKLRIVLLSENSRWINSGFIQLRAHESIETFRKELKASHEVIEAAMAKFVRRLHSTKSGIRYHMGEPKFGVVMTDKVAYVNTYAEVPAIQVIDLPIYRFERAQGSLFGAFKRHFDDLWHNSSVPGTFQRENIDLETSAGGIVLHEHGGRKFVALLRRHDGYWALPKGHRLLSDTTLEETALREVCEETGLRREDLRIERPVGYYAYDETAEQLKVPKIIHLFLMMCRPGGMPVLKSEDFADAQWWDISNPLPEMLHTYQKSYLHEVVKTELGGQRAANASELGG